MKEDCTENKTNTIVWGMFIEWVLRVLIVVDTSTLFVLTLNNSFSAE